MWTVEIVKARFIEAADIERRMMVKGGPSTGSAWPTYSYDAEDIAGWDDVAIADNLERWQGRKATKSPELTRWEEVFFDWTGLLAVDRRIIVWRWSQCIASGRSFSEWCERKGLVRMTAYNRMERVFANLATRFDLEARLLRLPDGKWALQDEASEAPSAHKMGPRTSRRHVDIHPPAYRAEPFTDQLTTPEAVATFEQHLADVNERRRKARIRKALRGVPGETVDDRESSPRHLATERATPPVRHLIWSERGQE